MPLISESASPLATMLAADSRLSALMNSMSGKCLAAVAAMGLRSSSGKTIFM